MILRSLWNAHINSEKISSTHLAHGFKTAFAAVLAYAITWFLNFKFGYWAVISAVIVMQVYVADSVEMCLYRFSGTLIGACLGVFAILVIPKTPFFIGAALFVTIGLCSFLTRYKTRYRMAAITVVIVIMTGLHSHNIIFVGLSRVFEICIGILCAFFVSILIFPKRKLDVLRENLKMQAEQCAEKCCLLVKAFTEKQRNINDALMDDLVKNVWDNHALLEKIRRNESIIYRKKFNENFPVKISVINRCVEHLRNMIRALNFIDTPGYEIIMSKELEDLAEKSGKALMMLMRNDILSAGNDLESMMKSIDIKLLNIRKEGLTRRFDTKKLVQVFSFYSSMIYFAEDILAGHCSMKLTGSCSIKQDASIHIF